MVALVNSAVKKENRPPVKNDMRLKIKDVAQEIGVSVATISRAMNPETRKKVAVQTLERISQWIHAHGYTPNVAARNLRKDQTKTIGIVYPYLPGIFFSSYYATLLAGISDYLRDAEYQFRLLLLKEDFQRWDRYDFRQGERVDGLILNHWFRYFSDKSVLKGLNLPFVIVNDFDQSFSAQFVYADHVFGGRLAAEHLYALGHRRIGIIAGPTWSHDSRLRIRGVEEYLSEQGIRIDPDRVIKAQFLEQVAYEKVQKIIPLIKKKKITALFCCNDQMAFGAIRRMREEGIRCPQDISVVGFDDEPRAETFYPALTTIHMPVYDLAIKAVQVLVDYLSQSSHSPQKLQGQIILPVSLVVRTSTRALSPSPRLS